MGSVNKVFLIGRLGASPEMRHSTAGKAICRFSLATDRWGGAPTEDGRKAADWHKVVAWDRLAETCGRYLSKGRQVAVQGRIRYDKYVDKKGVTKYKTEIHALDVTFLSSDREGPEADAQASDHAFRPLVSVSPRQEAPRDLPF